MGLIGKWLDLAVLVFAILGLLKGYRKGLVRELFSLLGAVVALVIAFHGYSSVAVILTERYPLTPWQAQAIAFVALLMGVALLAVVIGNLWAKAISFTPFAVLDHLGGAAFGAVKVGLVVMVLLLVFSSFQIGIVDQIMTESIVAQRVGTLVPLVSEYLDEYWPENWVRPNWLL
jgi:membrane protein required for colicin V production